MIRSRKHLVEDALIIAVSVAFAVFIGKTGIAHDFIMSLGGSKWLGIFLSGMLFTSIFTTAPALIILGQFAETTSLITLTLLGGLGAMAGDYLLFYLVKQRFSGDLGYLLSSRSRRFPRIFHTRLFRFFLPFIGALVIASPLPDELGIAMLGFSRVGNRFFLVTSFVMNGVGIFIIGWIARML